MQEVGNGCRLALGILKLMPARVLVLDNTLHPRLFGLARRWTSQLPGVAVDTVHAPSLREGPRVEEYTHLILTGSEVSLLKPPPWVDAEAEIVRCAAGSGVRILGSCFGQQMLVWALSGPQYIARAARPEVGWTPLEIVADDDLVRGLPNPWRVFSFHLDEVVAPPPPPWRVLGQSRACGTQILRWGDAPVWGIQSHPEISRRTAEFGARAYLLLARRRGGVPRATLHRPPADDQDFRGLVNRFLGDREERTT